MNLDLSLLPLTVWRVISRWGEAQILLPALLAVLVWFVWRLQARAVACTWLLAITLAALLTTASKVAFIGWGLGYAPLDFTGISGHAMFATGVWPLLAAAACAHAKPATRAMGVSSAYLLALVVSLSRLALHSHSISEVLAGVVIGGAASMWATAGATVPRSHASWVLVVGLAAWLAITPVSAPPSRTHDWVTRLSLVLSGHTQPYTRQMLHVNH